MKSSVFLICKIFSPHSLSGKVLSLLKQMLTVNVLHNCLEVHFQRLQLFVAVVCCLLYRLYFFPPFFPSSTSQPQFNSRICLLQTLPLLLACYYFTPSPILLLHLAGNEVVMDNRLPRSADRTSFNCSFFFLFCHADEASFKAL